MALSYNQEEVRKFTGMGAIGNEEDAYPLRSMFIGLGPHWYSISGSRKSVDVLKLVLFIGVTKVEVAVLCGVRLVKDGRF